MPARHTRKQDPIQRIHRWDDGYEYIRDKTPTPPDGRDPAPFFSPPPSSGRPYTYEPDPPRNHRGSRRDNDREDPYQERAYPSPPFDSEGDHARRRRHHSPPPPYRSTRSPSPPPRPRQRRPSLESRSTAPLPRSKYTRYRSPSPTARHHHGRDRRRSPSPILPGGRMHNRDRHDGDHHHNTNPKRRRHSRSPSPPPKSKSTGRPPISRSKTTTTAATAKSSAAAAAKEAKERFPGLSPRWQQAAMAAFQAGSMAALNMRSQPGAWNGEKGARVASAALGAAAMDAFSKKEKEKESGGGRKGGGGPSGGGSGSRKSAGGGSRSNSGVEAIGGVLGGFLADQFAKQRESKKGGRR